MTKLDIWKLTFNQEEEAQYPAGGNDESWDDERHSPRRRDEDAGDEGAQDVPHRGVRVPHAHDEPPPGYCKEKHKHTEAVRMSVALDCSKNNTGTSVVLCDLCLTFFKFYQKDQISANLTDLSVGR